MQTSTLPEEWEIIRRWLPQDLEQRAREEGFIMRERGITIAEQWLRLILMHVMGGLSLKQTVVRASEVGWAKISEVALFKRLLKAEKWLNNLSKHLLEEQNRRLGCRKWPWDKRIRVIDATEVKEPGSTGTKLRVHYSIQLPQMACDHYEVTDKRGGEKLGRFKFSKQEWVIADRGYSHRAGVAYLLKAGAQIIVRLTPQNFPLKDSQGAQFDVLKWARKIPKFKSAQCKVSFEYEGERFEMRLCARRKSRLATERSQAKVKDKARRGGFTPSKKNLELAGYILILTSIDQEQLDTDSVLELYRYRWQIELYFKRLKSIMDAGHVPKSNDASAKSWMQAKILTALLLERILLEARCFSPWGY